MICEECKGEVVYDPIHDESVRSACGLVQDVIEPPLELPLYPSDFKPSFLLFDSKPTIIRDYFGNVAAPLLLGQLKKIINPNDLPGPKAKYLDCLSKNVPVPYKPDLASAVRSAYLDEVKKDSVLLCDVDISKPYLLEDVLLQLFNFLFKISDFKPSSPNFKPRTLANRHWTSGSAIPKRIDPTRRYKKITEFRQSHYPKKIAYTSKETEEFWKDIGQKHKICRIWKHIPVSGKCYNTYVRTPCPEVTRLKNWIIWPAIMKFGPKNWPLGHYYKPCNVNYNISEILIKFKDALVWDEFPGEPDYHRYWPYEIGNRMKKYVKTINIANLK